MNVTQNNNQGNGIPPEELNVAFRENSNNNITLNRPVAYNVNESGRMSVVEGNRPPSALNQSAIEANDEEEHDLNDEGFANNNAISKIDGNEEPHYLNNEGGMKGGKRKSRKTMSRKTKNRKNYRKSRKTKNRKNYRKSRRGKN